jgi:hypothetical protein
VEWADHSSGFTCNADNVYYVKFRRIGSGYPQAEPGAWRRVAEWPASSDLLRAVQDSIAELRTWQPGHAFQCGV